MKALLDQNKTSEEATKDAVDFIGEWRLAIPPSGACAMSEVGHERKSSMDHEMSGVEGRAEEIEGKADIPAQMADFCPIPRT